MTTVTTIDQQITQDEIFAAHKGGKLITKSTAPLTSMRDLSIA